MVTAEYGTISLMAAFAVCVYGTVVPHMGVKSNNWNLIRSAQNASVLSFLLIAIASAVLLKALVVSDFSLRYVWEHSSTDMPLIYKLSLIFTGINSRIII